MKLMKSVQLVLPNGTITNVNATSHPDLLFALRGGNCNFGVVTRFDLGAYPQALVWGGSRLGLPVDIAEREAALGVKAHLSGWSLGTLGMSVANLVKRVLVAFGLGARTTDLIQAFAALANTEDPDDSIQAFLFLSWVPYLKTYLFGTTYLYSEPVAEPAALKNLRTFTSFQDTGRLGSQREFAKEVNEMNQFERRLVCHPVYMVILIYTRLTSSATYRNQWFTSTFKVDADFISKIWDTIIQEADLFRLERPTTLISSNIQLLSKKQIAHDHKNGGNAFGLNPDDGPLICKPFHSL
jgi:hypothetical protein